MNRLLTLMSLLNILRFSFAISGSGGFVAMMGLLLMQVGLSLDAIGAIMTANIFVTNFAAPVQWIMRDCDLLDFSYKVKVSANR